MSAPSSIKPCNPALVSPDYVPTSAAARAVGFSRNTLLRWAREGKVTPAMRSPGGHVRWDVADLERQLHRLSPEVSPVTDNSAAPVERPIVAAVVTSPLGMLVTWRNDKQPPAGFLTGEIEPGESPADAMVREVKEEAGLRVSAGSIIGDRVHPRTGRRMIYVTGTPTEAPGDVFVGDAEELADVRWITLGEADEAFAPFGGMYPPVHEHLSKTLGQ